MGAINFSIDSGLLAMLKQVLPVDVFVETGTFHGDSINIAKNYFKTIYSIELSVELYEKALIKYQAHPSIKIVQGDSAKILKNIVSSLLGQAIVYWLDAHWCIADASAGKLSQ